MNYFESEQVYLVAYLFTPLPCQYTKSRCPIVRTSRLCINLLTSFIYLLFIIAFLKKKKFCVTKIEYDTPV